MSIRLNVVLKNEDTKANLVRIANIADMSVNELINWILEAQFDSKRHKELMLLRDLAEVRFMY